MSTDHDLEGQVATVLHTSAPSGVPGRLLTDVLSTTSGMRPRPRWLALIKEPPMRVSSRVAVGSPTLRLASISIVALLLTLALAALAVAGSSFVNPSQAHSDWPTKGGNAANTGEGGSGPHGQPAVRWRFRAGGSFNAGVAVVSGVAYATSDDGLLHAIDDSTGSELWTHPGATGQVSVADGRVFATDLDGHLLALDASTGKQLWASTEAFNGRQTPIDGQVLVSSDSLMVSLDASSGAEQWRYNATDAGFVQRPAVGNGLAYAGTDNSGFLAIDTATGALRWTADLSGDPTANPVVVDGIAYLGATADKQQGALRAFDATTGDLRWKIDEPLFSPAISNGVAVSGSPSGVVTGRDATTGTELWRATVGGQTRQIAIVDGVAYVPVDEAQRVYALDARTGGELWHLDVDGGNQGAVALADGMLFVPTLSGSLYAVGGDGTDVTIGPAPQVTNAPAPTLEPTAPAATESVPSPQPTALTSPSTPASASPSEASLSLIATLPAASTGLSRPMALAFGPDGDIYVADLDSSIHVLTPSGSQLRSWGTFGTEAGQFNFGLGRADIAVGADGLVYVMDGGNRRVQVFQPDGTFVRQFGSFGTDPGQFLDPINLNVDGSGNVYLIDDRAETVSKIDPNGVPIWTIAGTRETDPDLAGHHHRGSFDSDGVYWMTNDDNGRVVGIDAEGKKVDAYGGNGTDIGKFQGTVSVVFDAAGNAYVDECSGTRLQVFDRGHRVIGVFDAPGGLPFGNSYAFGPDGRLYAIAGGDHCAGGGNAPTGSDAANLLVYQVDLP